MLWNKNCTHRILLKFEHRRHYNFVNASFFGFKKEEQQHLMIHVDIKQKGFFWNQLEEMKPNVRGNGVLLGVQLSIGLDCQICD